MGLDRSVLHVSTLSLDFAVNVLLNLLVGLDQGNRLALSLSLSINEHLAAMLVDGLLLSALLLHVCLEFNGVFFDLASVHRFSILVLEEGLQLLLVFVQLG